MPYLELEVLTVSQPLETFYVAKIKAVDLLKMCFTDPIRYENGKLAGGQRLLDDARILEIGNFISGVEAAFPNSVILSANFDQSGFNCPSDDPRRWDVVKKNGETKLVIPTSEKLASIIDGQHRIYGFKNVDLQFQEMELVCSVYLDLPNAYQAYLFATINSNQKKVDKSLAYEQFGFNIDKEDIISWSPDKVAISISRNLNTEIDSPLLNHVKIAPQIDSILEQKFNNQKWVISMSTIVDGIIRLITSNPKRDRYELQKYNLKERKRENLKFEDKAPLRELFLKCQDVVIYRILINFFNAANNKLFLSAKDKSTIFKTIGIQALFEALRIYILYNTEMKALEIKDLNLKQETFEALFEKLIGIDFSDGYFQFSGVGKTRILNLILISWDIRSLEAINNEKDRIAIQNIIKNKGKEIGIVEKEQSLDNITINVNDNFEVEYWAQKLKVTSQQIIESAQNTNSSILEIEKYLKKNKN